jgi:hypothetical protein
MLHQATDEVAQEHDIADLAGLGQSHPVARIVGEGAVAGEPGRGGVADEEWRDYQVDLVGEPGGEELAVDHGTAFDHQPLHATGREVG